MYDFTAKGKILTPKIRYITYVYTLTLQPPRDCVLKMKNLVIEMWNKFFICPYFREKEGGQEGIGEYSAKKIYFFPGQRKTCEKISPYFWLSEVENCSKLHFLGKKLSKLAFFWGKIVKICTCWGINCKNCKFRGKIWKILVKKY